jgi:hypothetical protein
VTTSYFRSLPARAWWSWGILLYVLSAKQPSSENSVLARFAEHLFRDVGE